MRKLSKALIALAIGIVVNALVITGIFEVPCIPAPPQTNTTATAAPAFGSLSDCSQARTPGFIIVGLADTFAAVMVISELAKHGR